MGQWLTCLIAVRSAVGFISPGSQTEYGRESDLLQSVSWLLLISRSANQEVRLFLDAQAYLSHEHVWKGLRPGTWLISMHCAMSSMP